MGLRTGQRFHSKLVSWSDASIFNSKLMNESFVPSVLFVKPYSSYENIGP